MMQLSSALSCHNNTLDDLNLSCTGLERADASVVTKCSMAGTAEQLPLSPYCMLECLELRCNWLSDDIVQSLTNAL
jgi:hypothetical protein